MSELEPQHAALDAVVSAIASLEDDEVLNAGLGSNLTKDGAVECDASLMDGTDESFGSVAALSGASDHERIIFEGLIRNPSYEGVKNPIKVAHSILKDSLAPSSLGLLPPL